MSGAWFLRDDDTLWLIPGDSPMGLRLPLDSIPWVSESDYPWVCASRPVEPEIAGSAEGISLSRAKARKRPANDFYAGAAHLRLRVRPGPARPAAGELGTGSRRLHALRCANFDPNRRPGAGRIRAMDYSHGDVR